MTVSLETAIIAIRSNRRDEGRRLLSQLIQQNPNNEGAWLWMSEVVQNNAQRAKCLQHVLTINPHNSLAQRGLERLGYATASPPKSGQPASKTKPLNPQTLLVPAAAKSTAEAPSQQLDPKAITQEMPFTPLRDQSAEENEPSAEVTAPPASKPTTPKVRDTDTKQRLRLLSQALREQIGETDSEPVPVVAKSEKSLADTSEVAPQPQPAAVPLPDFATAAEQPSPVEQGASATPVVYPAGNGVYVSPSQPTRPVSLPSQGYGPSQIVSQTQTSNGSVIVPLTRPTQPSAHAPTMGMPISSPPSQPIPVVHANTTLGMPQQVYPHHPSHGHTTMGMPIAPPTHQQPTSGMSPQPQAPPPNGQAMLPPPSQMTNQQLIAAWQNGSYRSEQYHAPPTQYHDEEEEEEVNLIAVFIFGFLSITALGGLGVLIIIGVTAGF